MLLPLLAILAQSPEPTTDQRTQDLAALNAQYEQTVAETEEEHRKADELRQKKCGKDYHRIRIGEKWSRVKQCSGFDEFSAKAQDELGTVFEAEGGYIWVRDGKVIKWVAP